VRDLIVVSAGGAVGAALRFMLCGVAHRLFGTGFPYGTLAVNATGGLAIGLLAGGSGFHPTVRNGVVVGILGGFTTFSAFSWDTVSLAAGSSMRLAAANLAANVAFALLGAWIGGRLSGGV
jgi:fluoride exporter